MRSTKRVILVGLDGATWDLVMPWVADGELPGFKQLMNGTWGFLRSTIPPLSPSAWTSIFTGTSPAKHSIFSFVKRREGSYFIRPISSKDRKSRPLWRILTDNARKSVLINIPFAYPPDVIDGIMTTGLGTPSKDSDFCQPRDLKHELLSRFPHYKVDFDEDRILLSEDKGFIIEQIRKTTQAHMDVAQWLYEREKWDFFAVVFRSLDVMQHYYWDDKITILQFYKQCDEFLQWVSGRLADDTVLLLCSDHGFSRVHTRVYVNNWLESLGLLSIKERKRILSRIMPSAETFQKILVRLGLRSLVWKLKRSTLVEAVTKYIFPSTRWGYLFRVDWKNTKAYFLEGSDGAIYLNLKDREPQGIITEEEQQVIVRHIVNEAERLQNPETGAYAIKAAYPGRDLYGGMLTDIPDVILLKNDGFRLVGGYNDSGHVLEQETERNGEHGETGVFIAYGSGVSGGRVEGASVCDLAPTILSVVGVPVPREIDGRVLAGVFGELSETPQHRVTYGENQRKRISRRIRDLKSRHRI